MKTDCLKWDGPHRHWDGRPVDGKRYAYRVEYEKKHGPLPAGVILHHECENNWCINLDHLRLMTQSEHLKLHGFGGDRNVGQALKTHCPAGHAYDEANTYRWRNERQCRICRNETVRRLRARKRGEII